MRDIRKDLKERIGAIEAQRDSLRLRLKRLDDREAMLKSFLQQEDAEWATKQPALLQGIENAPQQAHNDLEQFLITVLRDNNPHNTVDMATLAQNRDVITTRYPRKAVHITLVRMMHKGLVDMPESGVWRLKHENTTSVAGRVDDPRASSAPTHPA